MNDKDQHRGLYGKYLVERRDGSSGPGGKHERCEYFVLDLAHDKYAFPALIAYASACQGEYPELAADLRRRAVGEQSDELAREHHKGPLCKRCQRPIATQAARDKFAEGAGEEFCWGQYMCEDRRTETIEKLREENAALSELAAIVRDQFMPVLEMDNEAHDPSTDFYIAFHRADVLLGALDGGRRA